MSDACGLTHNYGHALKMLAGRTRPFEELCIGHCSKEEKAWLASGGWPLLQAVQLDTDAQLQAEAQVRKLEELRLKKDVQMSTTPLASQLADKVGEQDNQLKTLVCHLSNLRKNKLSWTVAQMLVTT